MINALKAVVHLSLSAQYDEGLKLSSDYQVGNTFPVFILTNSQGEVIFRWDGFGGAKRFVNSLKAGMADLTSVKERRAKVAVNPNYRDALQLAKYYSDTRQYLDAITYYKLTQKLSPSKQANYSYQIFSNTANAVWTDIWPFDSAMTAADVVLNYKINKNNISKCVKVLGRVARRSGRTNDLRNYLYAALEATANSTDSKLTLAHQEFVIDTILYITGIEGRATRSKEATLGANWQNDPKKFYPYAKWCLERKVNLNKAEAYARTAADRAGSGAFKGQVLHTLASILDVVGKHKEAVRIMEMSVAEDPTNPYYAKELDRILINWSKAESKQ
ncbi:MAG: hypothetical protein KAR42_10245 [candidate division Zixibacteria bacterium]|nr:hypothetical protein [candidate division Zixibacteria bacterium]